MVGLRYAALTMRTRSIALDTLLLDRPLESTKWLSFMPSSRALRFIACTKDGSPPG
ncbi:hypothetical protein FQZ97_509850 [compost metagenome]